MARSKGIAGRPTIAASVELQGAKELEQAIKGLGRAAAGKILRTALRASAKVIAAEAKQLAPVESGTLKQSIKVRAAKRSRGRIAFNVQSGEGDFKGETFYAAFLEYGYRRGKRQGKTAGADNRPVVPPRPFMRPAFDAKKDEALKVAVDSIWAGIKAEVARTANK